MNVEKRIAKFAQRILDTNRVLYTLFIFGFLFGFMYVGIFIANIAAFLFVGIVVMFSGFIPLFLELIRSNWKDDKDWSKFKDSLCDEDKPKSIAYEERSYKDTF